MLQSEVVQQLVRAQLPSKVLLAKDSNSVLSQAMAPIGAQLEILTASKDDSAATDMAPPLEAWCETLRYEIHKLELLA